jgi:hypothetical protein
LGAFGAASIHVGRTMGSSKEEQGSWLEKLASEVGNLR